MILRMHMNIHTIGKSLVQKNILNRYIPIEER